ncbi:MAG: asparagine synthase (glutamine-hydrolyzing) [Planctomycetota bacterium]|nr:asparagine synthase (glutamine-hydrolyzing) [Planctomycetota bacterium]
MCGITGAAWTESGRAISSQLLGQMTDALLHRGPDDSGYFLDDGAPDPDDPGVGLGFRRLAIIDLETGQQPVGNEDNTIQVVLNGEIYNYRDLREELLARGHQFTSQGDAEVIVHLYEEEGEACFSRLNGMFAIAIWDGKKKKLILARDRLGQKPLFYCQQPGRLLFGSELKSILAVPGIEARPSSTAVDLYFTYQYVPHPHCILEGFQKLSPGCLAVYQQGQLRVEPYWELPASEGEPIEEAEAVERLRELLDSSVRLRMQSDVPLGAFLSGGVDSSLIVALMQGHCGEPVRTFSIGFPVKEYDETAFARQVANHLGTEHHEFRVKPDGIDILPQLAFHFDEPLADSSAIPTWYVARETRQQVTVALSGDGGDELFAGYPRYQAVSLAGKLDRFPPLRWLVSGLGRYLLPGSSRYKSRLRRMKRFAEPLNRGSVRRYLDWIRIFQEKHRRGFYSEDFQAQLVGQQPGQFLQEAFDHCRRDPISQVSLADLMTYLPCDLMAKVDITTMAHSLECRQPMLDYRLVEFAAGLPVGLKYRRGRGKHLLQSAFGDLLPEQIWNRPKMGFGVPLDHWFRHELRDLAHDVLLSESACCHQYVHRQGLQKMLDEHASGRQDHSQRLWAVLMLETWMQRWSDTGTA